MIKNKLTDTEKENINKLIEGINLPPNSFCLNHYCGCVELTLKKNVLKTIDLITSMANELGLNVRFSTRCITIIPHRVESLIDIINSHRDYIINSDYELEEALRIFQVNTLDELTELYHNSTGYEVVDRRDNSEYSNVNAQRDIDFWAEESIN